MPKMIRILCSMKIFSKCPTVNVSKLNFWLVICIAKNLICTFLKLIFSIFRFSQICPDHNKPDINGKRICCCIDLKTLMTGLVLQGHTWKMSVCVQCSSSCDGGFQRRVVVCQDADGRSTNHCDERLKPDESKSCDSGPCPHWNYGIWGQVRLSAPAHSERALMHHRLWTWGTLPLTWLLTWGTLPLTWVELHYS